MTVIEEVAALVRAIRRAYPGYRGEHGRYGDGSGVTMFYIADVHDFAKRLRAEGVTVREKKRKAA